MNIGAYLQKNALSDLQVKVVRFLKENPKAPVIDVGLVELFVSNGAPEEEAKRVSLLLYAGVFDEKEPLVYWYIQHRKRGNPVGCYIWNVVMKEDIQITKSLEPLTGLTFKDAFILSQEYAAISYPIRSLFISLIVRLNYSRFKKFYFVKKIPSEKEGRTDNNVQAFLDFGTAFVAYEIYVFKTYSVQIVTDHKKHENYLSPKQLLLRWMEWCRLEYPNVYSFFAKNYYKDEDQEHVNNDSPSAGLFNLLGRLMFFVISRLSAFDLKKNTHITMCERLIEIK